MKLRFTVTAKSPQRIEVDPWEFVGMAESEVWSRITDKLFEDAVFSVALVDRDSMTFREAWIDEDKKAPKCAVCGQTFRNDDEVVAGDGEACHKRCHRNRQT